MLKELRADLDRLAPTLSEATGRARHLDEDASAMGEPRRDPTTGFYRLTESVARESQR